MFGKNLGGKSTLAAAEDTLVINGQQYHGRLHSDHCIFICIGLDSNAVERRAFIWDSCERAGREVFPSFHVCGDHESEPLL